MSWLGLATGDLVRLAPCDIDEDGNILSTRMKTGGEQHANIYAEPELLAVIQSFDRAGKDPTVPFLHTDTGRPFLRNTFRLYWRGWAKEAGLPADFKIHAARATMVVDNNHAGVSTEDGMARTGHADARVYQKIYGHHTSKSVQGTRAQQQLAQYRARKAGKPSLRVVA